MNSHRSLVFLLLLFSAAFAFNCPDYFYSSESDVTVSYENFTIGSTDYTIVYFNGEETFLLEEGEPLTDQSEIEDIMYSYFVKKHYPSEEEIDELYDLIDQFNKSRNDGYDWKNREEYLCRDEILFANGKISVSGQPVTCRNETSCEKNALLLYAAYGEGLGLGSVDPLYNGLIEFAIPSFAMDELLGNYTAKLDALDEDSVVDSIDYIERTVDDLKEYSYDIEHTIFRTPRLNDSADKDDCYLKCYAICPSFDLDEDLLDDIEDTAEDLADKISPLSSYDGTCSKIYNNTISRINYSMTEAQAAIYTAQFDKLNQSGEAAVALGDAATSHVSNASLSLKLDDLKALHVSIPGDIDARDFSTTDDDLERYSELIVQVNNSSAILLEQYNETKNAKNMANSLILVLETKDLDPVSMGSLELLKNRTGDLDARFRDGLAVSELIDLEGNYTAVVQDGQDLLKAESDMPATRVLLLFRGFARNVNEGIASVAEDTEVIEPNKIPDNKFTTLGLFSLILFLSLGSIILLVFLYVIASTRFLIPKTSHIVASAFVSLIVLLLSFSVFTYLFLSKTSTDATLTEFMADFEIQNSTAIIVDLKDTSYSDAQAMNSCAGSLAETFTRENKSWTIYHISEGTCTTSSSGGKNVTHAVSECWDLAGNETSSFQLGYSSSNQPPKFSVIYQNKALINANMDYYDSCPLVSLFS